MNRFIIEVDSDVAQLSLLRDIELTCAGQEGIQAESLQTDGAFFVSVAYDIKQRSTAVCCAAQAVCSFILREKEKQRIKKVLERDFGYFSTKEKSTIFNIAFIDTKSLSAKKDAIRNAVQAYLECEDRFSVEGLLHFRMQAYDEIIERMVDEAVEKYLADREYEEFLSLLRFFVSVQESHMDILHVVMNEKGEYQLFNEDKEEITNQCYLEFFKEYPYGSIRSDDFLISTLINLSPKKIILHRDEQMKNNELKITIRKVFGERIQNCPGCSLCKDDHIDSTKLEHLSEKPLLFQ